MERLFQRSFNITEILASRLSNYVTGADLIQVISIANALVYGFVRGEKTQEELENELRELLGAILDEDELEETLKAVIRAARVMKARESLFIKKRALFA